MIIHAGFIRRAPPSRKPPKMNPKPLAALKAPLRLSRRSCVAQKEVAGVGGRYAHAPRLACLWQHVPGRSVLGCIVGLENSASFASYIGRLDVLVLLWFRRVSFKIVRALNTSKVDSGSPAEPFASCGGGDWHVLCTVLV